MKAPPNVLLAVVVVGFLSERVSTAAQYPAPPMTHSPAATKPAVSAADAAKTVESFIKQTSKAGVFKISDKEARKELSFTLDRVHQDQLLQVGADTFVVSADLKSPDRKTYAVDFFVHGNEGNDPGPDLSIIHLEGPTARTIG